MVPNHDHGIVHKRSHHSVDETLERLKHTLQAKGVTIFAVVDHSGEAEKVGLKMRPTKLVLFGSPNAGTPLMRPAPSVAINLPLALALPAPPHGLHTPPGDTLAVEPHWSELITSMETMHGAMASVEPSHNSDMDFVRLMLPHHQAAIDMAKTQLIHGRDPQMRRLAQEIITDQHSEMELMKLWLQQRAAPPPNQGP